MTIGQHDFTSESVSPGHPDKVADQISDAVLDAHLAGDPESRVACEVMLTTGLCVVAGEISSKAVVPVPDIARATIKGIGYTDDAFGINGDTCAVMVALDRQSPDIAMGVDAKADTQEFGAGDQGMMFGFACRETDALMPLPVWLSHRLMERHRDLLKAGEIEWLRPDAKAQVTVRYTELGKPERIAAVVLSTQHGPAALNAEGTRLSEQSRQVIIDRLVAPVLTEHGLDPAGVTFHINPTGKFIIGGPHGDCGLTGRKIIVDTYGGMGRHGGGAFSGKDATKVDRSATYMARYIAKNLVAAGVAERVEVQLAYAIGVAEPVSVNVFTYGTEAVDVARLESAVREHFPLTPRGIIEHLDLRRPIFKQTAELGPFGRDLPEFTWERTDKVDALKAALS